MLELADESFLIELFLLSDDAHDLNDFPAVGRSLLNRDVFLPTVEDAIITKLRWFHAGKAEGPP